MKRIKILPLLLATSLLAGCAGNGFGISPKNFLDEGKVVTYKEGVTGYVQAVKNAKYDEWVSHNYTIYNSNNMYEVYETSYTKLDAKYKATVDSRTSSKKAYDPKTKVIQDNKYVSNAITEEGTYFDEDSEEIKKASGNSSNSAEELTYAYVNGMFGVVAYPYLKVYEEESLTGFDFDVYITDQYTQMLAPILVYYADFSALPLTTTEAEYKAAVEKAFNINTKAGDSITISLNDNVITFNYTTIVKTEEDNLTSETIKDSKMQLVLDQNKSVFNYAYHEVKTDKSKVTGLNDCTEVDVRTTDFHWSAWAEDSGTINKPSIDGYVKYENQD